MCGYRRTFALNILKGRSLKVANATLLNKYLNKLEQTLTISKI